MAEIGQRHPAFFSAISLSLIAPSSSLQEVITDRGAPKSDLRTLKQAGIEVTLV